jgi:flavin reductase (DIM6/NTAB) family NADH-FMN oxidoreductase RutF
MRKEIGTFDVFRETLDKLKGNGIILLAGNPPNPMTIGWGTLGEIWHMPVFTVLVRPTRFTFNLMEESKTFAVCLFSDNYKKELAICGSKSGRDTDKMKSCGFTLENGIRIDTPFITEADIHYECRIVHKHPLDANMLDAKVDQRFYPKKDYHMVYYGEILGVYGKM